MNQPVIMATDAYDDWWVHLIEHYLKDLIYVYSHEKYSLIVFKYENNELSHTRNNWGQNYMLNEQTIKCNRID